MDGSSSRSGETAPRFVPLVDVERGDVAESVHFGAIVLADPSGGVAASVGDATVPIYLRSAAKPFQLLPLLELGAADALKLGPPELAVMAASHSGEPIHTDLVAGILERLRLGPENLRCGAHPPYNQEAAVALAASGELPSPLHNNCSGKHTGMLALARHLGADPGEYLDPDSPGQRVVRESVGTWLGVDPSGMPMGVDGCSAPAYVAPLASLASAYARLAEADDESRGGAMAARVRRAMQAHPELVGGTSERLDTELMRLGLGLVAKGGAEGVMCVGIPAGHGRPALGLALKIADGDAARRARQAVTVEALAQLAVLGPEQVDNLGELGRPIVRNVAERVVGRVLPRFRLVS